MKVTEIILCVRTTFLYTLSYNSQSNLPTINQYQFSSSTTITPKGIFGGATTELRDAMPLSWHEGKDCKCVACRCFGFVSVCVCWYHAEIFKRIVRDLCRHTQWNKREMKALFSFSHFHSSLRIIFDVVYFLYILFRSQLYVICVCVCTFTPFR